MKDITQSRITEVMKRAVDNLEVPGLSLLVTTGGKEALFHREGYADLEAGKAFERDTIIRIYSMTKPITGAAVLQLVERGILELGEEICNYLPGFKDQKVLTGDGKLVPVNRPVTVRDLLSMTSGLPYGGEGNAALEGVSRVFGEIDRRLFTEEAMTTLEIADALGEVPLCFQPGEAFLYGTSADIAGAVIEAASGMRFGTYLEEEFFKPLGMKDTGFYVPQEKQGRLAKVYQEKDGAMEEVQTRNLGMSYDRSQFPQFESGGAGLCSTVDDYTKFAAMLLNGGRAGEHQILSANSVKYLSGGQLLPKQRESFNQWGTGAYGYTYGCFNRIMMEPGQASMYGVKGQYGWDGWLGCYFCNIPEFDTSVIMFTQKIDSGLLPVARRIHNLLITDYADESVGGIRYR